MNYKLNQITAYFKLSIFLLHLNPKQKSCRIFEQLLDTYQETD
jgi:hypothetical protein